MGAEESTPQIDQAPTASAHNRDVYIPQSQQQPITHHAHTHPRPQIPNPTNTESKSESRSPRPSSSKRRKHGSKSSRRKPKQRKSVANILHMSREMEEHEEEATSLVKNEQVPRNSKSRSTSAPVTEELSCSSPIDPELMRQEKAFLADIASEPKSPELRVELGNWLYHHNRREEAQFQYETALKLDPMFDSAHFSLATLHHQYFFDLAKSHHMTANTGTQTSSARDRSAGNDGADSDSDFFEGDGNLIYDTVVTHSITVSPTTLFSDQYKEQLKELFSRCESARVHYEWVIRLDEHDLESYYQLGYLFLTLIETLCYPSIDDLSSEVDIPGIVNITSILDRTDWDEDFEFDLYFDEFKSSQDCRLFMRNALWWKKIFEFTAAQFRKVMAINPSFSGAYAGLGRLYLIQCVGPYHVFWKWNEIGKTVYSRSYLLNEARRLLEKAIEEFDTREPLVYHDMALACIANTVHDRNVRRKFRNRRLQSQGPMPDRASRNGVKVKDVDRLEDVTESSYEDANRYWFSAIDRLDNKNPIFYRRLGHLFQVFLGNMQGAIYFYERSLGIQGHVQAYNNLATILIQSLQSKHKNSPPKPLDDESEAILMKAISLWENGLAIDPNHAETHRNLGNTLWIYRNDEANAEVHLGRAIAVATAKYEAVLSVSKDFTADSKKVSVTHDPNDRLQSVSFIVLTRCDFSLLMARIGLFEEAIRELKLSIEMIERELECHVDGDEFKEQYVFVPNVSDIDLKRKCACVYFYYGKLLVECRRDYEIAFECLMTYLDWSDGGVVGNRANACALAARICHEHLREFDDGIGLYRDAIRLVHEQNDQKRGRSPRSPSSESSRFLSVNDMSQMYLDCHIGMANALLEKEIGRKDLTTEATESSTNRPTREEEIAQLFGRDDHMLSAAFVTNTTSEDGTRVPTERRLSMDDHESSSATASGGASSRKKVRSNSEKIGFWYTTSLIREGDDTADNYLSRERKNMATATSHGVEESKKYFRLVLKFCQEKGRKHRDEDEDDVDVEEDGDVDGDSNDDTSQERSPSASIDWRVNELACYIGLARLYFHQKSIRNCETQVNRVIELCKSEIEGGGGSEWRSELRNGLNSLVDLIWCSFHSRRWKEGIKLCKEMMKLDNDSGKKDLEVHLKLGVLLWNLGDDDKAKQAAMAALEVATGMDEEWIASKKPSELEPTGRDDDIVAQFIQDTFPFQRRAREVLEVVFNLGFAGNSGGNDTDGQR